MPPVSTPEIPHPATSPSGSVRTTWVYTVASLAFVLAVFYAMLAAVAVQLPQDGATRWLLVLLLLSAATGLRYCWFLRAGLGGGLPSAAWTVALFVPAAVLWVWGLVMPVIALVWALPLWLAVCLVACLLPRWLRTRALLAGVALTAAHVAGVLGQQGPDTARAAVEGWRMLAFYATMLPFFLLTSLWWWQIVVELDRNRLLAGELAIARERLRFAADLHDIQGHHLQVIALKSELAERLIDTDPEAARGHLHEARLTAKAALEETRSLVSGYRQITLSNELENVREVLASAGTLCTLHLDPLPADPAIQRALALTAREATTNILRHSAATEASITFTGTAPHYVLTVRNDGVLEPPAPHGNGLRGLGERLAALGGGLNTSTADGHFTLAASLPHAGTPAAVRGGAA